MRRFYVDVQTGPIWVLGLASDYNTIILNSVAVVLYQKRQISPGHCELVVLKRSHEKHLIVGSGPVPYIIWTDI